ncbi:ankyrin repeat domain-containing protein [Flagellimonas sp. CMM7]|uniref:ankyrin repeat domain-containing protein n=1 Tax=Flagellimonas sp. CMM7 TaxID=2654676 RepID=UPI0013D71FFF|nr:ankyrin repeat domain-containing protein [Flagellimonas sp. CMM7]UII80237.1 ankyrin repeat domain-containing protein [Flagellimonas sp. CMM7]
MFSIRNASLLAFLLCLVNGFCQDSSTTQQEDTLELFNAINEVNLESIRILPNTIVNVLDSTGLSALSHAVRSKELKLVKLLLEKGANPNLINNDNLETTPLMQCSNVNSLEIAALLIEKGADVNALDKNGDPVIHWAAYFGQEELTQLLLDNNAKTDLISIHSDGVMQVALKEWKSNVVATLMVNGVSLVPVTASSKELIDAVKTQKIEFLQNTLTKINANTLDASGTPLLVIAAETGNLDVVKVLLEKGADIDIMNPTGHTALNRSIYFEQQEVVDFLLDQGADVNKTDNIFILPPLIAAAIKNNAETGKKLIELGAEVNVLDKINKFSPLTWAVIYGHIDFVKMILNYKPDLNIMTTYGTTVNEMTQNKEILNLLKF